jgi:hypothetical protein
LIRGKHWNDGWLTAYWGREERGCPKELIFGSPCRPDGRLLCDLFGRLDIGDGKTLIQELGQRGYDITTLQFSIKRKWKPNEKPEDANVR